MAAVLKLFSISAPLFGVVFIGYLVASHRRWRASWTALASRFVYVVALPALLFHMMSGLARLPPVDARLLIAFFGGCLIVFFIGRTVAARLFHFDGVAQSVFALGGVFSNNVLLGLPFARLTLGEAAVPPVALVLVFNALTLWTLVTISVEWAQRGALSVSGVREAAANVLKNPLVLAILSGAAVSAAGLTLPSWLDASLDAVGRVAAPTALLALGMGLAEYGLRRGWGVSLTLCALKLAVQPFVVWLLALALGLPPLETACVVLLASISVGVNVHLMAVQFGRLQGQIASSLVLSTALAAFTTPLWLYVTGAMA